VGGHILGGIHWPGDEPAQRALLFLELQAHAVGWSCEEQLLADTYRTDEPEVTKEVWPERVATAQELAARLKMDMDHTIWVLYI
jgi:hypothetical protein